MMDRIMLGTILLCVIATAITVVLNRFSARKVIIQAQKRDEELEPIRQQIKDYFASIEEQRPLTCGSCGEAIMSGMSHKPWCKYVPNRITPLEQIGQRNRWP